MSETAAENDLQQIKDEKAYNLGKILNIETSEQQDVLDTVERIENLQDGDEALLSKLRRKLISRKLMVWVTATLFFGFDKISEDTWAMFSLIWMGWQGSLDLIQKWRETR